MLKTIGYVYECLQIVAVEFQLYLQYVFYRFYEEELLQYIMSLSYRDLGFQTSPTTFSLDLGL